MQAIDLVVTWVNEEDPAWQNAYRQYAVKETEESYLYRDWGWMRYWFRGVENNMPWIRKVFFITSGHLPYWINAKNPKLKILRHENYIPGKYLPTFSSHTIEWNLHRISDLSEQFILCNDDMLFLCPLAETDYFSAGLPCDLLHICPITESRSKKFSHLLLNNMACMNRHFNMNACAKQHPDAWFSANYDKRILEDNRNALRWHHFPGLYYDHMPIPLLKSSIETLWHEESELLDQICRRHFRNFYTDINIFLARFYTLAKGTFVPYRRSPGKYCLVSAPEDQIADALSGAYPLVCLNEAGFEVDYRERRAFILSLLDRLFPAPSSFELS